MFQIYVIYMSKIHSCYSLRRKILLLNISENNAENKITIINHIYFHA